MVVSYDAKLQRSILWAGQLDDMQSVANLGTASRAFGPKPAV